MTGTASSSGDETKASLIDVPSQDDYASFYEEWRVQPTKHTQRKDSSTTEFDYAKALATRAGKRGTLQCAIRKSETNTAFLQALVERLDMEERGPVMQLPKYVLQSTFPKQHQQQHANNVTVCMDYFFQENPECRHREWEAIIADDSSSEDGSSEEEERKGSRRKKRPLAMGTTLPVKLPALEEKTAESSCILGGTQPKNHNQSKPSYLPNHHQMMNETRAFNSALNDRRRHQQHFAPHNFGNNSHRHDQHQHNNSSFQINGKNRVWEDCASTLNRGLDKDPGELQNTTFQSAKEYAAVMRDQGQLQRQQQNYQPDHNPQVEEELVVPKYKAPASLKRKFVHPKLGPAPPSSNNNDNKSRGTTNNISNKKNQGTINKNNKHCTNGSEETDDDDLPEALQRHGKDLVGKIESEIMERGDKVTFDDIAGLEDAKKTIDEIVCWPMKRPDLFTGLRKTPNGLLLFGPPGTGKTLIGKAIAHASGATFFSISSSALTSKWMGEGEKLVRCLFGVAAHREPSCIFLDEVDSLLTQRKSDDSESSRRIKTEFLVQLDGSSTSAQGRVLVIGATNRPQELDEAARRRFVKRLYIPLPNEIDRACLLRVLLGKNDNKLTEKEVNKLAHGTDGFSGADLKALSAEAAMGPIRELGPKAMDIDLKDLPPITYKHFRQALQGMQPSVSPDDISQYIAFDKTFGSKRASEMQGGDGDESDSDSDNIAPS